MDMAELTIETESLVTLSKAAEMLGVSRPTIYNWIKRHRLHPVLVGRNRYLFKHEVDSLIRKPKDA